MAEPTWSSEEIEAGTELVRKLTGIVVPEYRWPVVHAELERIAASSSITSALARLSLGDPDVRYAIFTAAAIPETYMFRHAGHFRILADFVEGRRKRGLPTSVLCAGCSTGEEAWSVAAVLASLPAPLGPGHRVIGWDLCPDRVEHATRGTYGAWSCRSGFMGYDRYFDHVADRFTVAQDLRSLASFQHLNLLSDELPANPPFDVIFFRNVSIYWRESTISRVCARLGSLLADDGVIFVGPSDPVDFSRDKWEQRIENGARGYWKAEFAPSPARSRSSRTRRDPRDRTHSAPKNVVPVGSKTTVAKPPRKTKLAAPMRFGRPEHEEPSTQNSTPRPLDEVQALADAGRYEQALAFLRSSEVGTTIEGRMWRGILLMASEREEEAIDVFRQCVFLCPTEAEYRRWLATAYETVGRTLEAEREHRNARELSPP